MVPGNTAGTGGIGNAPRHRPPATGSTSTSFSSSSSPSDHPYNPSISSSSFPPSSSSFLPSSSSPGRFGFGAKAKVNYNKGGANLNSTTWFGTKLGGGLERISKGEWKVVTILVLIGCWVRWWKIARPGSVVFDEVHFGGFATKYIKSRFFMDVHPPLAKLLITLAAWLAGFNGNFDFKDIGKDYLESNVPYVAMRMLPSTLGILLIPLTYLTLRLLGLRPLSGLLGSLLVTFDNGLITQSRHILLDSPLLFFTALTTFAWCGFMNECAPPPMSKEETAVAQKGSLKVSDGDGSAINEKAKLSGDPRLTSRSPLGKPSPDDAGAPLSDRMSFNRHWWGWLCFTGLGLGATASVKWVGLFTIATIGLMTIQQLWTLLGNRDVSLARLARHFYARAYALILIPTTFYLSMFLIHFAILTGSGEGDGFMSSEFQHTLRGHGMADTYADVMLGSRISIRHLNTQGGYLHSHPHTYPGGSNQQQITLYPHRDENNDWHILNTTIEKDVFDPFTHSPPVPLKHLTTIRLNHINTNKRLHSHDVRPPVTDVDYQNEVSAYGFEGFDGDANDHWVIEFNDQYSLTSLDSQAMKTLRTLRTRFRLRHALTGCYLFSHKVKLPDWGWEQQEVTCNKNPSLPNSIWYVETNSHPTLPENSKKVNYRKPGFLQKFWELQKVMWRTNAGLTERHSYDSRPQHWPVLRRGINFWVKDHRQIYLLGNPAVWWTTTLGILISVGAKVLLILRAKRGYRDLNNSTVAFYDRICIFLTLGWGLHYFPFFIMQRQLFLHHYFPALWFAILLLSTLFDLGTAPLKPKFRVQIAGVFMIIVVWTWLYFSPLAYAGEWTRASCNKAKWLENWDFSCPDFHENLSQYAMTPTETIHLNEATQSVIDNLKAEPNRDVPVQPAMPEQSSAGVKGAEPGPNFAGEEKDQKPLKSDSGVEQDGMKVEGDVGVGDDRIIDQYDIVGDRIPKQNQKEEEAKAPQVTAAGGAGPANEKAAEDHDIDEVLPAQPEPTQGGRKEERDDGKEEQGNRVLVER